MIFPTTATSVYEVTPKEVLSAREVAELLGVNIQAVYEAARKGDIPHRRIGKKRLLFSRAAVMAWVECKPA